jgi:hypothetical protein
MTDAAVEAPRAFRGDHRDQAASRFHSDRSGPARPGRDLPKAEALRGDQLDESAAERTRPAPRPLGDPARLNLAVVLREGEELCGCDLAGSPVARKSWFPTI